MAPIETMPNGADAERAGPYAALAAKARTSSDGALVAAAAAGALWVALLLVVRPAWWQFVVAPAAVGAYGVWGVADRELADAPAPARRRLLRAACAAAAVLGTAAVALTAFRVLGALVGTVIS